MKTIFILISVFTSISFAGGTGGGGVLASRKAQVDIGNGSGTLKAEMVRFVGTHQAEIVFEYGQLNAKNELYTQILKLRAEEFSIDAQEVLKAIELSKSSKDWSVVGVGK